MNRRQFLTLAGIASASAALAACAPPRLTLNDAFGTRPALGTFPAPSNPNWHALQRMTYGVRADELAQADALGLDGWIEEQLAPETIGDLDCELRTRGLDVLAMDTDLVMSVRGEAVRSELQRAQVLRAVYSKRQLYETMAEFWTDHFSISIDKLDCLWLKVADDRVLRQHTFGNFGDLLWASMQSPAMLHYLDNHENFKDSPNENYARELLELHTLGVDAGYTQHDVRQAARCLTGWTVNLDFRRGQFQFEPSQHDDGSKQLLGVSIAANGGARDVEQLHAAILNHPALPHMLARKLVRRFVADTPPEGLVAAAAETFRATRGDIRAVLKTILYADEFRQPAQLAVGGMKYKRPLHFVAGALRQLNAETPVSPAILDALARMGQPLYQWAMPDGFPDRASAWNQNLLPRWQFALALVTNALPQTTLDWAKLTERAGAHTLREAAGRYSALLVGVELTRAQADVFAAQIGETLDEVAVQVLVAALLASPQYQWR